MINVLIAEDDIKQSIRISNTIYSSDVRCIGILNEGTRVYERLKELNPEILILDLRLPGKNGLEILEEIENDSELSTKVIVYSGDMGYITLSAKYKCISNFFSKFTPPEQLKLELERIADENSNEKIENRVRNMLNSLGFSYALKGTRLINECIIYAIENNEENINNVYEKIAEKNHENVFTLKSDINTAIKNMWRYADKSKTKKILRLSDYDKPSTKGIISMAKYYVET